MLSVGRHAWICDVQLSAESGGSREEIGPKPKHSRNGLLA